MRDCISDLITSLYRSARRYAAALRPACRAPVISSKRAARLVQVGQHEFLRHARPPRPRPPAPTASRACSSSATCRRLAIAGAIARARSPPAALASIARAQRRRSRRRSATTPSMRARRRSRRPTPAGRSLLLDDDHARPADRVLEQRAIVVGRAAAIDRARPATVRRVSRACRARAIAFVLDRVAGARATPAVSTSVSGTPSMSTRSVSRSRVVPGTSVTMARAAPRAR